MAIRSNNLNNKTSTPPVQKKQRKHSTTTSQASNALGNQRTLNSFGLHNSSAINTSVSIGGRDSANPSGLSSNSQRLIQRKCKACSQHASSNDMEFATDKASHEQIIHRKPSSKSTAAPTQANPSVANVLNRPGKALDSQTRGHMESRFNTNFAQVRIHNDTAAAEAANSIQAKAFTVGNKIVFGDNNYQPRSRSGQWLLAHELTHVVQQRHANTAVQAFSIGAQDSPQEHEADQAANDVLNNKIPTVAGRTDLTLQRFPRCRHILDSTEETAVSEADVQAHVAPRIRLRGPTERELPVAGASFSPFRTPGRNVGQDGFADIALMRGTTMEVMEIKRGTWPMATDAERQLNNYVIKGNADKQFLTDRWRQRGHSNVTVNSVVPMPTSRYAPTTPGRIGGVPTSMAWCNNGLFVFKAIGTQDPDVFACGEGIDTDRIIDAVMDNAEAAVDRFLDNQINPALNRAINTMPTRDAILMILRSPTARELLTRYLGSAAGIVMDSLPLESAADFVADRLGASTDRTIRLIALRIKARVIAELRNRMKAQLNRFLSTTINALCARGLVTTVELLAALQRSLAEMMVQLLPNAIEAVVIAMAAELLESIGEAILEGLKWLAIIVAVVIVAIVLWEVAAAIAAAVTLESILAFLGGLLTRLVPLLI